ncbi:MAG: hypothetical protein WCQ45_02010, partial [bacterium]
SDTTTRVSALVNMILASIFPEKRAGEKGRAHQGLEKPRERDTDVPLPEGWYRGCEMSNFR